MNESICYLMTSASNLNISSSKLFSLKAFHQGSNKLEIQDPSLNEVLIKNLLAQLFHLKPTNFKLPGKVQLVNSFQETKEITTVLIPLLLMKNFMV